MNAEKMCPCGSHKTFATCCAPYLSREAKPPTPEALMRSRYTAYVERDVSYLRESIAPDARSDYDEKNVREWAEKAEWLGLEILRAEGDTVEFIAKYRVEGKTLEHHEVSTFRKVGGRWYYVDGDSHTHEEGQGHHHHHHEPLKPIVRGEPKVGRNDPCVCGSGKKFKKCCG